jgi:hypothetical protein
MLPHKTTKAERRTYSRMFKQKNKDDIKYDGNKVVVAYGNTSVRSNMPGHPSLPQKITVLIYNLINMITYFFFLKKKQTVQRKLARIANVIRVDEYRTSIRCSICQQPLYDLYENGQFKKCEPK